MGVVGADRRDAGFLDVGGGVEVGLADLHVDHPPALRLDPLGAGQDLERALGAEPSERFAEVVGVVGDRRHGRTCTKEARSAVRDRRTLAELMRTLTEAFAPGAPSLPEGLRTLVVSPDRTVEPGTTVRATFAFYNFGGAAATGLRVRFSAPEGLRYIPGSARVDDRALEDVRGETALLAANGADVGEVPPGVERRIALAYVLTSTVENGAVFDLQAALVANETDVIGSNVVRLVAQSAPVLRQPRHGRLAGGGAGRRAGRGDHLLGPGAQRRPRHRPRRGRGAARPRLHRLRPGQRPDRRARGRDRRARGRPVRLRQRDHRQHRPGRRRDPGGRVPGPDRVPAGRQHPHRAGRRGRLQRDGGVRAGPGRADRSQREPLRHRGHPPDRRRPDRGRAGPPGAGRDPGRERRHLRRDATSGSA